MRLIILDKALKFYKAYINEDEEEIEVKTYIKYADKTRVIIIQLLKTGWTLKDRKEEGESITYLFEKSKERKENEANLKKTKLFKDYNKNPYDERLDNEFLASLKVWIKNIFNKYSLVDKEDFVDTVIRMDNYIKDFLICDDLETLNALKTTIKNRHKNLKGDITDDK